MKKHLKQYEEACNDLAIAFARKHFDATCDNVWWVGDVKGEVCCINDFFFCMEDIAEYVRCGYTSDEMTKRYYSELKEREEDKKGILNIKTWLFAERGKLK